MEKSKIKPTIPILQGERFIVSYIIYLNIDEAWEIPSFSSKSIDVPRPLTNDLWVFLFQTIDAECVKWASLDGHMRMSKLL